MYSIKQEMNDRLNMSKDSYKVYVHNVIKAVSIVNQIVNYY